jgi:hypothetical protein
MSAVYWWVVPLVALYSFGAGVLAGRKLHQHELQRERRRRAALCRSEVAPLARAWLQSHATEWLAVSATAAEVRKYVCYEHGEVLDAVRVTFDELVKEGGAERRFQEGIVCGGYHVYQARKAGAS